MTIKQLSVFLENKTGRINDVTKTLAKYDINMHAFSMACLLYTSPSPRDA